MKYSIGILFFMCTTQGATVPFLLQELHILKDFPLQKPEFITASDGCKLAYYSYVPENPRSFVVFYHGAGFYSGALYQYFAKQLAEEHSIGCYLFDIRGHGASQGPRGDTPTTKQVFDDVTTAIDFVGGTHPHIPVFLGGHSSGGGLVLTYSAGNNHPLLKGSLLIAPYLGRNSEALKSHANPASSFIKSVRVWVFIVNGITGGYLCNHTPAVFFNYPPHLLQNHPLIVTSYTPAMLAATSPESPRELFGKLTKPIALFAAEHDEQFDAQKLLMYKKCLPEVGVAHSVFAQIPHAHHLDCMLHAARYCASFISQSLC